jgi:hypothetical protein
MMGMIFTFPWPRRGVALGDKSVVGAAVGWHPLGHGLLNFTTSKFTGPMQFGSAKRVNCTISPLLKRFSSNKSLKNIFQI